MSDQHLFLLHSCICQSRELPCLVEWQRIYLFSATAASWQSDRGHYCTGLIAAAAVWVLLHFGWMFKSGVLLHMCVGSKQISIYSKQKKKDQNINNASEFLSSLCMCFEYDCPSNKFSLHALAMLLHEVAPDHLLMLEEIVSCSLTSDRDLYAGKTNIKLI